MDQDIPSRDSKGKFLAGGISGIVELQEDGFVVKSPWPGDEESECQQDLRLEAEVYRRLDARLGNHDCFLKASFDASTYTLKLDYMRNGTLRDYLRQHIEISNEQRYQWALAAAEGLHILHSIGVVHCDFTPKNMLLDDQLKLKIIDFGCSSVDGARSSGGGDARSYPDPEPGRRTWQAQHDIFALGSTIYEISTGTRPYHDISSKKVKALVKQRVMPGLDNVYMADVIRACWMEGSEDVKAIHDMILELVDTK